MKKVVSNSEVPHLWAHQTQQEARAGNLFFEGASIFSYGRHFEIARIVERKGKRAVLFTTAEYSVTTTRHKSVTRRAIPSDVPVFNVPAFDTGRAAHATNARDYKARIVAKIEEAARSRVNGKWMLEHAERLIVEAESYARFFGLGYKFAKLMPQGEALAQLRGKLAKRAAADAVKTKERRAKEAIARAEQDRIAMLEEAERAELWRAGDRHVSAYALRGTYLRIEGDEVATSRGARIPVSRAKFGLRIVRMAVAAQMEYVRNGHTIRLGSYPVDRIEADGTLHAGCHVIPYSEIERIAPLLDAINAPEGPEVLSDSSR